MNLNATKALPRIPPAVFSDELRKWPQNLILTFQSRPKSPTLRPGKSVVHRKRTGAGSVPVAPSDISPRLIHNPVGESRSEYRKGYLRLQVLLHSRRLGIIDRLFSLFLQAFQEYFVDRGKVIALLVDATGTVMLVFGMGLYELSSSAILTKQKPWRMGESPRWLEVKTVTELKTRLGHVIVMLRKRTAIINTPLDLLCFSASVLLSSGCLYLLSKLKD